VSKLAMESEEFAQFLRDPTVPLKQKSTVLQEVLSSVKVNDLTKNFFSAGAPPPPPPAASAGAGWARWEAGGRRKLPADAEALPGPLGGQRLLVQPAGKADADAAELPKARRPQP